MATVQPGQGCGAKAPADQDGHSWGHMKSINEEKCYGHIDPEFGGIAMFHYRNVTEGLRILGQRRGAVGSRVSFIAENDPASKPRRWKALDVRIVARDNAESQTNQNTPLPTTYKAARKCPGGK